MVNFKRLSHQMIWIHSSTERTPRAIVNHPRNQWITFLTATRLLLSTTIQLPHLATHLQISANHSIITINNNIQWCIPLILSHNTSNNNIMQVLIPIKVSTHNLHTNIINRIKDSLLLHQDYMPNWHTIISNNILKHSLNLQPYWNNSHTTPTCHKVRLSLTCKCLFKRA
jgi:hypothetical protein